MVHAGTEKRRQQVILTAVDLGRTQLISTGQIGAILGLAPTPILRVRAGRRMIAVGALTAPGFATILATREKRKRENDKRNRVKVTTAATAIKRTLSPTGLHIRTDASLPSAWLRD